MIESFFVGMEEADGAGLRLGSLMGWWWGSSGESLGDSQRHVAVVEEESSLMGFLG